MKRESIAVADLVTDPDRFQVRRGRFAETIADNIKRVGWSDAKAGEFHVWPEKGKFFILDGHSRYAGIQRLDTPPKTVRGVVYDCSEDEARRIAEEMNASRAELTRTEKARTYWQAFQRDEVDHSAEGEHKFRAIGDRYRRVADRLSGCKREDIERDMPLAFLGEHASYLVDNDFLPVSAARSLGRFVRRTGATRQQSDDLASVYIQSGFSAHQFAAFLREAENDTELLKQEDMFGEYVEAKVADTQRLIAELRKAKRDLVAMEERASVFRALSDTVWRASPQQQALLDADQPKIEKMRKFVQRKSSRLVLSKMVDDLNKVNGKKART